MQRTTPKFTIEIDGEIYCSHEEAYLEPACCSPFSVGDSGYVECGCGGMDSIMCPDVNCTGIEDWEVEDLMEALR